MKPKTDTTEATARVSKALAACKSDAEIRRAAPMVQLMGVAKGMVDAADVRIGGTLNAEESMAFFNAMTADGSLGNIGSERMRRLTKDLDSLAVTARQLKRVAQGSEPAAADNADMSNPGNTLNALPAQLFASLTLDALRDNADNPQFVGTVRERLNTAWQNDLADLAMNGTDDDYTGSAFLELNEGFLTLAAGKADVIDVAVSPGSFTSATAGTGVVASNNALTWTAVQSGAAGNDIRVVLSDPGGNSQALAVSVSGNTVTVSLATGAGGAITSTAALVKAAVAANANAAALVTVDDTGASTGAGVVAPANLKLSGGGMEGWIDAFAAMRAGMPALHRDRCAFFVSGNVADAYNVELGKHVTGAAVIANSNGAGFLAQRVIPWPTMPDNRVIFTPPENLVVGIHDRIERDATYSGRKRALEITMDAAFDFEFRADALVVLGTVS